MNVKERMMLDRIKNYPYDLERIHTLEDTLASRSYKVTASYSLAAGGGGGGFSNSKVESFALKTIAYKAELKEKNHNIAELEYAISNADITPRERKLLECVMAYGTLSTFARQNGIYYTQVYKIRDRAVRKLVAFLEENPYRGI